jgi:glutathione S-transferase
MDPRDQAALERSIREHDRGPPLAERIPGDEHWKGLEQALDRLAHVDLLNRQGRPALDDSLTFADFLVASFLKWLNASVSDDQFERVLQWNGGRWKVLMDQVKPYSMIDEGESYN